MLPGRLQAHAPKPRGNLWIVNEPSLCVGVQLPEQALEEINIGDTERSPSLSQGRPAPGTHSMVPHFALALVETAARVLTMLWLEAHPKSHQSTGTFFGTG